MGLAALRPELNFHVWKRCPHAAECRQHGLNPELQPFQLHISELLWSWSPQFSICKWVWQFRVFILSTYCVLAVKDTNMNETWPLPCRYQQLSRSPLSPLS